MEEHLSRCPSCQRKAESYARDEQMLLSRLFGRTCPPSITIGEFAMGILPMDEAQSVAEHLLECPRCAAERRSYSAFMAEPEELLPEDNAVARLLRRLFAQPVVPQTALALRGDEDETTHIYNVDGYALTIGIQRATRGNDRVIVGLMLDGFEPGTDIIVRLFSGDRLYQTTKVDDLGNFQMEGVRPGDYRIELGVGDTVIVVEPVRVE